VIAENTRPKFDVAPSIRTERLWLRGYQLEDFHRLAALYETDRSAFIGGRLSVRRVWDGFMNCVGQWPLHGFGGWAVEEATSGVVVGEVAIQRPPDYPETELGWLLFEGFEGRGYAYEAAVAARHFAFQSAGISSLVSYIDPDNMKSIRLAEKLGAKRDEGAKTPNGDPCVVFRH
jgi:RimJ/RimL family protein N-acetyltransferase